jgi:hypothetical protein
MHRTGLENQTPKENDYSMPTTSQRTNWAKEAMTGMNLQLLL